jgi:hypothetical protein
MRRALAHVSAIAGVVLVGRAIAYALVDDAAARDLAGISGGPRLAGVIATSIAVALVVSTAAIVIARLAAVERGARAPRSAWQELRRCGARALGYSAGAIAAFDAFETIIHVRAGLGWHALHCLSGPVHANALPILIGLATVAAAVTSAFDLLRQEWASARAARAPRSLTFPELPRGAAYRVPRRRAPVAGISSRGPPGRGYAYQPATRP